MTERIRQWEDEERARSAADARQQGDLVIRDLDRYAAPPADTPYALEYCAHLLGDLAGKVVLDLGCGAGENSVLLAMRKARVIGLDISPELLTLARRRMALHGFGDSQDFRAASCLETGLPDHSVDGVFAIAILHHLVIDLDAAAREIRRILKPGGFVILLEPVRDSFLGKLFRRFVPAKGEDISAQERPLTTAELLGIVSGMRIVATRRFRLPHLVFLSGKLARELDRNLLRTLPFLSRYASVSVVKAVA